MTCSTDDKDSGGTQGANLISSVLTVCSELIVDEDDDFGLLGKSMCEKLLTQHEVKTVVEIALMLHASSQEASYGEGSDPLQAGKQWQVAAAYQAFHAFKSNFACREKVGNIIYDLYWRRFRYLKNKGHVRRKLTPQDVRSARLAAGLTQTQAASLIHHTLRAWQYWESGQREMSHRNMDMFHILTRGLFDSDGTFTSIRFLVGTAQPTGS